MNPTAAAAVADAQRHDLLDALRGLALFGVLLVNLRAFSLDAPMSGTGRARRCRRLPGTACSRS